MRRIKAACIVLAALNLIVFLLPFWSVEKRGLEVRVPRTSKTASGGSVSSRTIVFRPEGEFPAPPTPLPAAPESEPVQSPLPDERIDAGTIVFLGSMTTAEGKTAYFFKNKITNRVYSSSMPENGIKILSQSEKEFILEIEGTRYKVIR
jgi:hypothetical protein